MICLILAFVCFSIVLFPPSSALATETLDSLPEIETQNGSGMTINLPTFSSNVVQSIVEPLLTETFTFIYSVIDAFLVILNGCFSPSLSPLVSLERGDSILLSEDSQADDHISIDQSITIKTIWRFAFAFGLITATLLALINLLICTFGRSEDIRDTPLMIGVKYFISVFMIYLSKYFMTGFINLYGDIWKNLVISGGMASDVAQSMRLDSLMPIRGYLNGTAEIEIFGIAVNILGGGSFTLIFRLLVFIVGVVCVVILLKDLLKLYLEIIERYFVFFMLVAFFPIFAATLTTNNSKRVFYSYLKIVYTQGFLLIINTIFMSIFFYIAINGGWAAGILNYLAALAFLRLCQRIDSYMSQMGIGVVQTGGALANSINRSGVGLLTAMRAASMFDKGRQNTGKGIKELGARTNDPGKFAAGSVLGASLGEAIGGKLTSSSVSQTFATERSKIISASQGGLGASLSHSFAGANGDWGSVKSAMTANGMNAIAADNAITGMKAAGYEPTDISGMIQNDKGASSFSFETDNGKGGIIGTVEGDGEGNRTQISDAKDMEQALKQQQSMEQSGTYGDLDKKYTKGEAITRDSEGVGGDLARYLDRQDQRRALEKGKDSLSSQDSKAMSDTGNIIVGKDADGNTIKLTYKDSESAANMINSKDGTISTDGLTSADKFTPDNPEGERIYSSSPSSDGKDATGGSDGSSQTEGRSSDTSAISGISGFSAAGRFDDSDNGNEKANDFARSYSSASETFNQGSSTPLQRQDTLQYVPGTASDMILTSKYGNMEVQRNVYAVANHPELRGKYPRVNAGGRDYYIERPKVKSDSEKQGSAPSEKKRVATPGNAPQNTDNKKNKQNKGNGGKNKRRK